MSETPHPHAHAQYHHDPHTPPDAPKADTYETANKRHFDATAHQYGDHSNARQARAEKTGQAMKDTGLFKRGVTTVMDFACGTGESVGRPPFFIISRFILKGSPHTTLRLAALQVSSHAYWRQRTPSR